MKRGERISLELGVGRQDRPSGPGNVRWRSHAEVVDLETRYEMRMTVYGVVAERLSVEIRDEVVIVKGRQEAGPHSASRDQSDFHRMIGIPADASGMGATARLEGELLVVRIPKVRAGSASMLSVETQDGARGGP